MKKAITFALIAILFLGLFAGCNTYRRPVAGGVVDGAHVTREFQYRPDGHVTNSRTTTRHSGMTGRLNGTIGSHHGTTTPGAIYDGTIGDGTMTNRSGGTAYNGHGYGTAGTNWASRTPAAVNPAVNGTTARTTR